MVECPAGFDYRPTAISWEELFSMRSCGENKKCLWLDKPLHFWLTSKKFTPDYE
jgi:hypothetical protein